MALELSGSDVCGATRCSGDATVEEPITKAKVQEGMAEVCREIAAEMEAAGCTAKAAEYNAVADELDPP
jgi:hypothetical protein